MPRGFPDEQNPPEVHEIALTTVRLDTKDEPRERTAVGLSRSRKQTPTQHGDHDRKEVDNHVTYYILESLYEFHVTDVWLLTLSL